MSGSTIIDIALGGIMLLILLKYTLKGFVGSILDSLKVFVAAVLAYSLRHPVALLYNRLFMRDSVTSWVKSSLNNAKSGGDSFVNFVDLYEAAPSFFNSFLSDYGLRDASQLGDLASADSKQMSGLAIDLGSSLSMFFSTVLAVISLFIIFLIVLKLTVRVIDRLINLTPIKTANRLLGFVFGLVYSVIVVLLLSYLLELLVFITGGFGGKVTAYDLNNSVIVSIVRFFI